MAPNYLEVEKLSQALGVLTSYRDAGGVVVRPPLESILRVLSVRLGHGPVTPENCAEALAAWQRKTWELPLEPVYAIGKERPPAVTICLPAALVESRASFQLTQESGETETWILNLEELSTLEETSFEGRQWRKKQLPLKRGLPAGYHHLRMDWRSRSWESTLLVAPRAAEIPCFKEKSWGIFAPLYALHSRESWGAGDLKDLATLAEGMGQRGARFVATLPLLSGFFGTPLEISPYRPVSRLFWNEFYLHPEDVPGFEASAEAQALVASPDFQRELNHRQENTEVDYAEIMKLKRRVIQACQKVLSVAESPRRKEFEEFCGKQRWLTDYAGFRAAVERRGLSGARESKSSDDNSSPEAEYHRFAQWALDRQWKTVRERSASSQVDLYLDFPLGVHPEGFDTWKFAEQFSPGVSMGAPPDAFFTAGQNWASPPLHPERIRENGYHYFRESVQGHLRRAHILRIDHVMAFHRLFWIPEGADAKDGVYVRYAPEEFYAILDIESQRHQAVLVGEDLGTVPEEVRNMMERHRIKRCFVSQFETAPPDKQEIPEACVASLNTHDMQPFAGFWGERPELAAAFRKNLLALSRSPAERVLVNLEDLWLETRPQNIPGTGSEALNWRHKARFTLEELFANPSIQEELKLVDAVRNETAKKEGT